MPELICDTSVLMALLDELEHHRFRMSARVRQTILQAAGEAP